MRKMSKFLAIALTLVMILSLNITAFATEITDSNANLADHAYDAYKIFEGTQATDSSKLAVSGWGEGVNDTALLTALKASTAFGTPNPFADCETALDVSAVLGTMTDYSEYANEFAKLAFANKATVTVKNVKSGDTLPAGYYLVVDVTANTSGENQAVNLALLQQTKKGDFTIATKVDVPEVEKKVDDKNESYDSENNTNWEEEADYDIGDNVPFQLTATMPGDLANYEHYWLRFEDRAGNDEKGYGLTYNEDAKLYVVNPVLDEDGNPVLDDNEKPTYVTYEVSADDYVITLANQTVGEEPNEETIAVGFDLVVADALDLQTAAGAKIPVDANSKLIVEYTATLNDNAVIGQPGNPNTVKLQYSNNPNVEYNPDPNNPPPHGETPPDVAVVFTYKLIVNKTDDVGAALNGATFRLEKWVDDPTSEDDDVGTWKEVATIEGLEFSTFEFAGLDDGKYKLVEVVAPAGYNKAADIEFTISLTVNEETGEKELTVNLDDFEVDHSEGTVEATVENRPGTLLPETGGIGTTMFYVIGGLLAVAAVVLLVTKKRMASAE